jgi:non-ribosomal peptide synthetase component F
MDLLLQDLVTRQVELHPDAAAVIANDVTFSRQQVDIRSNQLARLLRDMGCRRGDRVCVIASSGLGTIVPMLAALKADLIYVPLELTGSVARIAEVVRSCDPVCILTVARGAPTVERLLELGALRGGTRIGSLEDGRIEGRTFSSHFSLNDSRLMPDRVVPSRNRGPSPAYVVFPSLSGSPGVVCTHARSARFLTWAIDYFGIGPGDHHPFQRSGPVGLAVFQATAALAGGAALHVLPAQAETDAHQTASFLRHHGLTLWSTSVDVLGAFAEADVIGAGDFPALRQVVWWGGEAGAQAISYWRQRLGHVKFTALVGSSDVPLPGAYYTVGGSATMARMPVGVASPGCEVLLLDSSLKPVGAGETGEIYVAGAPLSPVFWRGSEVPAGALQTVSVKGAHDLTFRTGLKGQRGDDGRIYPVELA